MQRSGVVGKTWESLGKIGNRFVPSGERKNGTGEKKGEKKPTNGSPSIGAIFFNRFG